MTWPDHGVPKDPMTLIEMVNLIKSNDFNKIIVHCSAGVGRTGTFIALSNLMDEILIGGKTIDVFKTVFNLRADRKLMVSISKCVKKSLKETLRPSLPRLFWILQ